MAQKRDGPNWKKIKAEYVRGGISQEKLAAKHGVPVRTLFEHARKEKWTEARKEACRKVAEKLPEKIADVQVDTTARLLQMQSEAALVIYGNLLETAKSFPNGVGTKNVRETVEVKKLKINGEEREFPLHKTFTNDLEAVVRSMTALARLYGIDAASQQARERLDMQKKQDGEADDADAFNSALMSVAELVRHPTPDRLLENIEAQEDEHD